MEKASSRWASGCSPMMRAWGTRSIDKDGGTRLHRATRMRSAGLFHQSSADELVKPATIPETLACIATLRKELPRLLARHRKAIGLPAHPDVGSVLFKSNKPMHAR